MRQLDNNLAPNEIIVQKKVHMGLTRADVLDILKVRPFLLRLHTPLPHGLLQQHCYCPLGSGSASDGSERSTETRHSCDTNPSNPTCLGALFDNIIPTSQSKAVFTLDTPCY
jgi:hypothetical protein